MSNNLSLRAPHASQHAYGIISSFVENYFSANCFHDLEKNYFHDISAIIFSFSGD